MVRINALPRITGSPADSDGILLDSTVGDSGVRIVLWSVMKTVLSGIFASKSHRHNANEIDGTVSSATSATNDSTGQNIASTYVKELTVNGRTVTVKRGNNTTYTFQTQDTNTTYPIASDTQDGLMSKAAHADLVWTHDRYLEHVEITMHGSVPALHFWNQSPTSGLGQGIYIDAATTTMSGIMSLEDKKTLDYYHEHGNNHYGVVKIETSFIDKLFRETIPGALADSSDDYIVDQDYQVIIADERS